MVGFKVGFVYLCVGWQVTLCDSIWQERLRSYEMGFSEEQCATFTTFTFSCGTSSSIISSSSSSSSIIMLLLLWSTSMEVTAEMLRPFLEGWTLKQIIDAKRLFIVDMKILDKLPTKNNRPVMNHIDIVAVGQQGPIAIPLNFQLLENCWEMFVQKC